MIRSKLFALPLALAAAGARAADGATPTTASLLQVLLGLIAVLALMAGAAWLLKRFGAARGSGNSVVRIVGGVSVGNRERVLVVEVGNQWVVVGVAPGRVNALASMPCQENPAPPDSGAPPVKSFSAWLKQTADKRHGNQ